MFTAYIKLHKTSMMVMSILQATPRQLERLLEESNSASTSVSSTSPDSGLQLEDNQQPLEEEEVVFVREGGVGREAEDTVMESRSILRTTADQVRFGQSC